MRYIVQSGDTMFLIARRFGVSLTALIAANPQILDPNVLFVGQIITIPGVTPTPTPTPMPTPTPTPRPPGRKYVVQPGDTMFLIARRFGVSLTALIAANPQIPDPNIVFTGQIINIP